MTDIDECAVKDQCVYGTCINSRGSFVCECPRGLTLDATKRICQGENLYNILFTYLALFAPKGANTRSKFLCNLSRNGVKRRRNRC